MAREEKEIKKIYWKIGEVANEFHVANSLIRFWLKEFDIRVKKSVTTGDRMFTAGDRERLREIYYLVKVEGFTLWGAKRKLEGL